MAINFPNTPELNEEFTANGVVYMWDGTKWTAKSSTELNPAFWVRDDDTELLSPLNPEDDIAVLGTITKASKPVPNVTISTADPSGTAMEGDLWITVEL